MKRAASVLILIVVIALCVAVFIVRPGHAPIPPVFSQRLSLPDAAARAAQSGRPVLVFATADWCGPCQQFKRTTLVDPAVADWITQNAVPVYLDVDRSQDLAGGLSIMSIPTSIMMRDGQAVSRLSGAVGVDEYLAWLKTSSAAVPR